jgi:type IV pilus assembly protein PilV
VIPINLSLQGTAAVNVFGKRTQGEHGENHEGFTLIEVLLALFILSIGLLGLAALQNRALKDNHSALLRSVAVQHAEDILDRMRANRADRVLYTIGFNDPDDWDPQKHSRAELSAKLTASYYKGLVHTDMLEWKWNLAQTLPLGNGSIAVAGNPVTVVIRWREGDEDVTVTINGQL